MNFFLLIIKNFAFFIYIHVIILLSTCRGIDIQKNSFGYEERKTTIEKCSKNLKLIFKENLSISHKLDYDYVMNHCINIDRKFLKTNLKIFHDMSKLKQNYQFLNLLNMSKPINNTTINSNPKSNFLHRISRRNIPQENILALYNCLNVEALSRKYFYLKTSALKKHKEDELKLFNFYKWLKENGAKFDKVDIYTDYETGMRGLYSLENTCLNENLIYIPENILLTSDKTVNSIVGKKLRNLLFKMLDYEIVLIALFLIEESQKANSFWQPYIDVLPQDMSSFPTFYTNDEVELVRDYGIYSRIIEIRNRTHTYYNEYICPSARNEFKTDYCQIITYEKFFLFYFVVKSRVFAFNRFRVSINGLSPLSDFLNHSYQDNTVSWRYSHAHTGFIIYAATDNNDRREVLTTYGRAPDESILVTWGFAIGKANPFDSIALKISLSLDDRDYYLKFMLLEKNMMNYEVEVDLSLSVASLKTIKFLNMFRFMTYKHHLTEYLDLQFNIKNKVEMRKRRRNTNNISELKVHYMSENEKDGEEYNFDPYGFNAIDIDDELYMISRLRLFLLAEYSKFPTTLEHDEYLYDTHSEHMSFNMKNIFVYRIGQKKILLSYVNFCDLIAKLYNMNYKEFEAYIKKHKKQLEIYEGYIYNRARALMTIYKKDI